MSEWTGLPGSEVWSALSGPNDWILRYIKTYLYLFTCCSSRCCVRDSQVWYGYCCDVGDAAGAHHEVHHPCRHGGYHCYLRPRCGCTDCQQPQGRHEPLPVSSVCVRACVRVCVCLVVVALIASNLIDGMSLFQWVVCVCVRQRVRQLAVQPCLHGHLHVWFHFKRGLKPHTRAAAANLKNIFPWTSAGRARQILFKINF